MHVSTLPDDALLLILSFLFPFVPTNLQLERRFIRRYVDTVVSNTIVQHPHWILCGTTFHAFFELLEGARCTERRLLVVQDMDLQYEFHQYELLVYLFCCTGVSMKQVVHDYCLKAAHRRRFYQLVASCVRSRRVKDSPRICAILNQHAACRAYVTTVFKLFT